MKKTLLTMLLCVLASGLTAYGVVKAGDLKDTQDPVTGSPSVEYRTVNLAGSDYPDFTYAAETAVEAVVYVEVTVVRSQQYDIDPFFRYFFGDITPQSREQKGSGSGVIIREDGYIVTNNHVVDGATKITVTLNNNQVYDATVVGTDPATDVAIIKVDATGLPVIEMGDSDALRLGEWVLAIGSPLSYNLRSTITAGIVSAKGRSMPSNTGEFKIESFIQTDAAVNPGNSGGALVNKEGKLVGINTAIISQTGGYEGYSFAVPVNIVKRVVADLLDYGSVQRPRLGISMRAIDQKTQRELKLSSMNGVYINEVSSGSSADEAGLKAGDVLIAIDGFQITDPSSVQARVNNYHPGDKATLTYIRDGKEVTVPVVFQAADVAAGAGNSGAVDASGLTAFYGGKLRDAAPETLRRLGISFGVEVVETGNGALAASGIPAGFVIQYVNDQNVSTAAQVVEQARKAARGVYIQGVDSKGKQGYFAFGK